ncbi:MAG: ACP S-malonyltransferase [bacterium]|nr:ACP S-malonyltransferase [bacterium]
MVKRAFIFPGQGTQIKDSDVQYILNFPTARDIIRKSSSLVNLNIEELLLKGVSPEDTEISQLVTYVLSLSLFYTLESRGITADFVAGHSLGEFSALTASRVMSFEDGLNIVKARGRIMADACREIKGGMIAVLGMDKDELLSIISSFTEVEAVNFNSPKQIVISGKEPTLSMVESILKEKGAKRVVRLNVAGPFHSSFLKEYSERFYVEFIENLRISDPKIEFISSVNGKILRNKKEIKDCLRIQMYSPVRWVDVVRTLEDIGSLEVVEIGTSNVLTNLVKQCTSKLNILGNALEVLGRNL